MPDTPSRPSVTHAEAVPEPLPRAEASGARALALSGGGPAATLGAAGLGELATAFTANAQALEGVGALQVQLLEALKRSDRSELVLASAQGLNDSFRSLGAIQKALLEQLEKLRGPAVAPAGRAVPLLLLGLCAVVMLATWALVGAIRDFGSAQPDARLITEHTAQLLQSGRDEAAEGARHEAQRLQSQVKDGEERVRTLQERLDAEREEGAQHQRELSAKESELDALRRQAAAAQNEALKMMSLENEIKLLSADAALVDPRIRGLERELEEQRRDNTQLRKRIASSEMGYAEAPDPPPSSAPPPGASRPSAPTAVPLPERTASGGPVVRVTRPLDPAEPPTVSYEGGAEPGPTTVPPAWSPPPSPATAFAPPPPLGAASGGDGPPAPASLPGQRPMAAEARSEPPSSRDPALVEQVRTTFNTLLEGARARRPDYWTFARVDGVAHDRLRGVVAQRHDSTGRVLETVEAREALVWVDQAAKRVTLELVEGVRTIEGQRGDFREGRMEAVVADGEAVALFTQSGLRQVRTR